MANYISRTRTNYFSVTDTEAYKQLIQNTASDCGEDLEVIEDDGKLGFLCNGSVYGIALIDGVDVDTILDSDIQDNLTTEEIAALRAIEYMGGIAPKSVAQKCDIDFDFTDFVSELSKLIAPDDACIIIESGYEKFRIVEGYAYVVTHDDVKSIRLTKTAEKLASDMLMNPEWTTKITF